MEKTVRLLKAEEIECRVSTVGERGISLLLYKDARVDQKILDETFTPFGWRRSHQTLIGDLYCTVEIWDKDKGQWIGKQDVGTESNSEKEKGRASDSFKRACFNWGIGRELYTAPFIWIPADRVKLQWQDNRWITRERFQVRSIGYNDRREIVSLEIVNGSGKTVFVLKPEGGQSGQKETGGTGQATGGTRGGKKEESVHNSRKADTADRIKAVLEEKAEASAGACLVGEKEKRSLQRELERTKVHLEAVLNRYGIKALEQMTQDMYHDAMKGLKRTKPIEAA